MVQMLRVDIGDDRDRPVEAQEAAVALVGLDHDPVAGAKPGIRTVIVDDAAVDDCRVDTARIEQRGDEAGRRRLAVRPRDRDGRSEEHTSELQSLMRISYAVFCLKQKKQISLILTNT